MDDTSSTVLSKVVTTVLSKVVKEIGGSDLVYENKSCNKETVKHEVSFTIPSQM